MRPTSSIPVRAATRQFVTTIGVVTGVALSAVMLTESSVSAQSHTAVPSSCPPKSVIASALKVTVSNLTQTSATASGGTSRTCTYATSAGEVDGHDVVPTTIRYGSPVTKASFAEQKAASSKGAAVVTVTGLGSEAFAIKAGNGLFVLDGTLEIVVSAPKAPEAHMVALGHKIL